MKDWQFWALVAQIYTAPRVESYGSLFLSLYAMAWAVLYMWTEPKEKS